MKLALISLSTEDPDGGGPIGLLPLFDSMLVDRQVRTARRLGAEKIVFLCPTLPGTLLQYMDILKAEGIDTETARTARDLVQYASADDRLLIFGDGILPSANIEDKLASQDGEAIYVVGNADIFEDFERIDLNQRWVGLAQLSASRLSMLIDIPDDWNVGSALLRIAVQSECQREIISDPDMTEGAVVHLEDGSETEEYTRRRLKETKPPKMGFLDRLLLWPVTRRLLPRLWQIPNAKSYLFGAGLLMAAMAMILAYFQFPIAALSLVLIRLITGFVRRKMDIFSAEKLPSRWLNMPASLLTWSAMILVTYHASSADAMVPNLILLVMLIANLVAIDISPETRQLRRFHLDIRLVVTVLLIAAIFGHFLVGLYAFAILTALYLAMSCAQFHVDSGTWPDSRGD